MLGFGRKGDKPKDKDKDKDNDKDDSAETAEEAKIAEDAVLNRELRSSVDKLLDDSPDAHHEDATRLLVELAEKHGPYVMASKVRVIFDAITTRSTKITPAGRRRVYGVIADLLGRHVRDEVAAIEQGRSDTGPNVFATYCSDYFENVLSSRGMEHAMLAVVQLTERLLTSIMNEPQRREAFAALAEVVTRVAHEQLEAAAERRNLEPTDSRQTPIPMRRATPWDISEYAGRLHDQVFAIREGVRKVDGDNAPRKADLAQGITQDKAQRAIKYLRALLELAAESIRLHAFAGLIEERAAAILAVVAKDRARITYRSAIEHLEEQAKLEAEQQIKAVAMYHYAHAKKLADKIHDQDTAARLQENINDLTRRQQSASDLDTPANHGQQPDH